MKNKTKMMKKIDNLATTSYLLIFPTGDIMHIFAERNLIYNSEESQSIREKSYIVIIKINNKIIIYFKYVNIQ